MYEGFFLGCAILMLIWFIYAVWKPLKTIYAALILSTIAWIPSLFYGVKLFHYAGYTLLPILVLWIVTETLKQQRGEISNAKTE